MRIILITFCFLSLVKSGMAQNDFDSLKVYTRSYYSSSFSRIDQSMLMMIGDSLSVFNKCVIGELDNGLRKMIKKSSSKALKKIREDFNQNLDVSALFIFFKGKNKTVIGISHTSLMFIDNLVYEKLYKKLEDVVRCEPRIYNNLFN